jgi:N-acetylmuramoyl-L-alanine amidase
MRGNSNMKITINGGHYPGLDSDAVGASGLQEAIVGYEVLEVQENEIYQITDTSNNFGSDASISIHCNAVENTNAKGTETLVGGFLFFIFLS